MAIFQLSAECACTSVCSDDTRLVLLSQGTLITDIAASITGGVDDDAALNVIIQQYLDDWGLTETVAEWRIANYAELRSWGYPPFQEYIDELVTGNQSGEFLSSCEQVNLRFGDYPENPATTSASAPYTIVADSTDTFTITDIPVDSYVTVYGFEYPYPDGEDVYPVAGIEPITGISWAVDTGTFVFMVDKHALYYVRVSTPAVYTDKLFAIFATEPV